MERGDLSAVEHLQMSYDILVAGIVIIHVGNKEYAGQVELVAQIPGLLGTYLDTGLGINYDNGAGCHAERFLYLAYKIKITGSIQEIVLNSIVFDRNHACPDGELTPVFFLIAISLVILNMIITIAVLRRANKFLYESGHEYEAESSGLKKGVITLCAFALVLAACAGFDAYRLTRKAEIEPYSTADIAMDADERARNRKRPCGLRS